MKQMRIQKDNNIPKAGSLLESSKGQDKRRSVNSKGQGGKGKGKGGL
jgi:hypothetical protein